MATSPRAWPTKARQQRDEAADVASAGRSIARDARSLLDQARLHIRSNPLLCSEMLSDLSNDIASISETFADIERLMAQAQALDETAPRAADSSAADAQSALQLYLSGRISDGDFLAILHEMRRDVRKDGGR